MWWWLEGNIDAAGITRDLEAMKAAGFGGAEIYDGGSSSYEAVTRTPAGPAFMSPAWQRNFVHAVKEATRLGLELGLNMSSGWNCGGPWVPPHFASRKLVWSETLVEGPRTVAELPLPAQLARAPDGSPVLFEDVAVVAVEAPPGYEPPPLWTASSTWAGWPTQNLSDGDPLSEWVSAENAAASAEQWLERRFAEPTMVRGLKATGSRRHPIKRLVLEAWVDDAWQRMGEGELEVRASAPVRAQRFRVRLQGCGKLCILHELELLREGAAAVPPRPWQSEDLRYKALHRLLPHLKPFDNQRLLQPGATSAALKSLPLKKGEGGYSVPAGRWVMMRFGATLTGAMTSTSSPGGRGFILDHLDPAATDFHFGRVVAPLLKQLPADSAFKALHCDSWEGGATNWSAHVLEGHQRVHGYSLVPWLPAIAGFPVEGRARADAVLADFRRTIGGLVADAHYGRLAQLATQHGLQLQAQAGGPHPAPVDAINALGRNHVPFGEIWAESPVHRSEPWQRFHVRAAASAAHVRGRPFVAAEAFTSLGRHWDEDPRSLKPVADRAFLDGVNRIFVHTFTHSPPEAGRPGNEYFAGTHFNPNVTWWPQAKAFVRYMARAQWLLSRGQPVADVAYFYGDQVPNVLPGDFTLAGLPPGHDFDVIDAASLARGTVREGVLRLPAGPQYRALVVPADFTPPQDLTAGGVPVFRLGDALKLPLPPDFECDARLKFVHRRGAGREIYFVVNTSADRVRAECSFRVRGLTAELWDPATGGTTVPAGQRRHDERVSVPLDLFGEGAIFVVFGSRTPPPAPAPRPQGQTISLDGPWTLSFPGGPTLSLNALKSWTTFEASDAKYFSGTATYRTQLELPSDFVPAQPYWLDFGELRNLAELRVNDQDFGVLWKTPFAAEVGAALRPGQNSIELRVTNNWPNRLIGDAALPLEKRKARTNVTAFGAKDPLRPSGLLGPVRLSPEL